MLAASPPVGISWAALDTPLASDCAPCTTVEATTAVGDSSIAGPAPPGMIDGARLAFEKGHAQLLSPYVLQSNNHRPYTVHNRHNTD